MNFENSLIVEFHFLTHHRLLIVKPAEDESDIKFILAFVIEASETVVATPTSNTFPYTMMKSMLSEDDKVPDDGKKVIVEPDTEKAVFGA